MAATATIPETIPAADSAAVIMMLLAEDQTTQILSALDPDELRILGEKMCALGEIGPDIIAEAITRFVAKSERMGLVAHDRVGQVRTMMNRAVGDLKADNVMSRIAPATPKTSTLELARWLTAESLVPLLKEEHPQAIAVLLVQLSAEVAAAVLHVLPIETQPEIVHRIATLGPVSAQALEMLEELLARRITQNHGARPLHIGGAREAAEIVNGIGKVSEKRLMEALNERDEDLARQIEEEMFKFEHLYVLDAQSMGVLLRDVASETLIDALKGIADAERDLFFRAMSSRAADGVRDEIAAAGRVKMADVVVAQKAIVAIARKLAEDGALAFGSSDNDYV